MGGAAGPETSRAATSSVGGAARAVRSICVTPAQRLSATSVSSGIWAKNILPKLTRRTNGIVYAVMGCQYAPLGRYISQYTCTRKHNNRRQLPTENLRNRRRKRRQPRAKVLPLFKMVVVIIGKKWFLEAKLLYIFARYVSEHIFYGASFLTIKLHSIDHFNCTRKSLRVEIL